MVTSSALNTDLLRVAIQEEYGEVAVCPLKGFHFRTARQTW